MVRDPQATVVCPRHHAGRVKPAEWLQGGFFIFYLALSTTCTHTHTRFSRIVGFKMELPVTGRQCTWLRPLELGKIELSGGQSTHHMHSQDHHATIEDERLL